MKLRILLSIIACLYSSSALHAEYESADLKSLFTDKSQRARIDAARSGVSSGTDAMQADEVKVSGYLKRSDGKNVVWVNGENTLDSSKLDNIKIYPKKIDEKSKKVPVNVDGSRIYIKPGESWSRSTGKIEDNY